MLRSFIKKFLYAFLILNNSTVEQESFKQKLRKNLKVYFFTLYTFFVSTVVKLMKYKGFCDESLCNVRSHFTPTILLISSACFYIHKQGTDNRANIPDYVMHTFFNLFVLTYL